MGGWRNLSKNEFKALLKSDAVKNMKKKLLENGDWVDKIRKFLALQQGIKMSSEDVANSLLIMLGLFGVHTTDFACPKCSEELQ